MASIEKRSGGYRVRYRDPGDHNRSRTFRRKVDAERFAREVEVDMDRGQWIDPRGADVALEQWVETFMTFARSLVADDAADVPHATSTATSSHGSAPSGSAGSRRGDRDLAQRRAGQGPGAVVGPPPLPDAAAGPADRRREGPAAHQPVRPGAPAEGPEDGHDRAHVGAGDGARRGALGAVPDADLPRHRHRHALERARRAAAGERRRRPAQDPGGRAARPARRRLVGPPPAEDRRRHADGHDLGGGRGDARRPPRRASSTPEPDALVFTNGAGQPLSHSSFQTHHFREAQLAAGVSCRFHDLRHTSVALGHRRGRPPEGDPGPHGPQLDHRHPRPLRPPLPRARRSDRHGVRRPLPSDASSGRHRRGPRGVPQRRHTLAVPFARAEARSEFYGIAIYTYWNDHEPAHFHAIYSGDEALVRIDDGTILAGSLPRTAARLVQEWRLLRRGQPGCGLGAGEGVRAAEPDRRAPVGCHHESPATDHRRRVPRRPPAATCTFSDGLVRELDFVGVLEGGVLEPLNDPVVFSQVAVDPVAGTIVWANGVDLDPDVLHGDQARFGCHADRPGGSRWRTTG